MDKGTDNQPEDDKPTSKTSFGNAARYMGVASGISGGMVFCAFSLALHANTDNRLWLIGAGAGVLATIGSFVQIYQMSKQDMNAAPKDKPPGDKPDLKP